MHLCFFLIVCVWSMFCVLYPFYYKQVFQDEAEKEVKFEPPSQAFYLGVPACCEYDGWVG